ncbi:Crp/Fnr family transcriptional regulator, partial [Propionivibrio sp.]|uniref:Crp/Fnr family transcriptional regulator n=1 Tax=Propionivibrio sp. TaxID=2212460 RepID=UPI003BF26DAE
MNLVRTSGFKRHQDRRTKVIPLEQDRRKRDRRQFGLTWIPLFRDVAPDALLLSLSDSEVMELPANTRLLTPGEHNQNIFILFSGDVVVHLDSTPGTDNAIPIAPGECIGELSAIDGKPVSALVLARSNSRVLKLSPEVFWNRLMTLPSVARNLRISLSERMRRTSDLALTAQREQLELIHLRKELDVARQLQASMLPLQRPLFAERDDIEVCGFMVLSRAPMEPFESRLNGA